MTSSAQRLMQEMREERAALRMNIVLTALTAVGLLTGVGARAFGAPDALTLGAFAVAYLAGGVPATLVAARALGRRHLDIDLLMVVAALAAAAVGEVRDGAILLFLFSLAGTLEDYAMGNTKRAVVSLMKLRPDTANVLADDGTLERTEVTAVRVGQRVVVRPGERVPVDGVILQGASAIDQAPITGESVPVDKEAGDKIFAGTVNGHGALEVRVTKEASQSTLARMIELVTEAQSQRSPSERFSQWFGQRYTFFVLFGSAAALGVFLLIGLPRDAAFYKAATLLVVASPCSIVISVPAAVLSALAAAARMGVLFKGGAALEDFGATEIVAFDKTGTLTEGRMRVTDVIGIALSDAEVLSIAAAIEQTSEHPLARSILERAQADGSRVRPVTDVMAVPGKGIRVTLDGERYWAGNRRMAMEVGIDLDPAAETAVTTLERQGRTAILVGNGGILGAIGVADTVRSSARATLDALAAEGVHRIAMLTGDHAAVAENVGTSLGLRPDDVFAGPPARGQGRAHPPAQRRWPRHLRGRRRERRRRARHRVGGGGDGHRRLRRGARGGRRRAPLRRPAQAAAGLPPGPAGQPRHPAEPGLRPRDHAADGDRDRVLLPSAAPGRARTRGGHDPGGGERPAPPRLPPVARRAGARAVRRGGGGDGARRITSGARRLTSGARRVTSAAQCLR